MSGRSRPQYYDVIREAHEANQQPEELGRASQSKGVLIDDISKEGFHHIGSGHLGRRIAEFVASKQRVWSASGIAILEDGIQEVACKIDPRDRVKR